MREILSGLVGPVAKAVAAFVMPLLAVAVAAVVEKIGINVPYDPSAAEALVTSVVTSVLVWLVSNTPAES